MISVLIVNPRKLIRAGLRDILLRAGDVEVTATASQCDEGLLASRRHRPRVVLISEDAPGVGTLEATRRFVALGDVSVVGIAVNASGPFARRMLNCGARGLVTYLSQARELVQAVRFTARDQTYLAADVLRRLAQESLSPCLSEGPLSRLSDRELQVFRMIISGQDAPSISRQLCLSRKTVSTYRYRIQQKLGTRNDVELVRLALAYNLFDADRVSGAG